MSLFHALLGAGIQTFYDYLKSNSAFFLDTSNTTTMFQQGGGGGGNPTTTVTANGNPVGCIYDVSKNAIILRAAASAGQWPVLGSDATRNGYLTFDGSNDRIASLSVSHLNNFHSSSPSFSMYLWVKFNGGNGVNQVLLTNNNLGTGTGFHLFKNTSNKLVFATYVSAVNKATATSTTSLTSSSGWLPVIISINGTGATAGRLIIGELEDVTFAVSAGSSASAAEGCWIGSRSSLVHWLNASIGDIVVLPTPATTDLIADYKAYNPTRTSTEFTPRLQWLLDFSDTTRMFSDAGGTTQATNGSVVRLANGKNNLENFGSLDRNLTAASDSVAPIYRASQVNGYGAIEFDGVNDNLDFLTNTLSEELAGKYFMILVCRNRDATDGSHIMSANSASGKYIALTGENYVGAFSDPYFAVHTSDPAGVVSGDPVDTTDAPFKLLAIRRNGLEIKAWNSDLVTSTDSTTGGMIFTDMGDQFTGAEFANWRFDGYMVYLEKWNGLFTDAQVEAKINELKTKYNIT